MVVCGIIFTRFVGHRRLREAVTRLADGLIVLSPRRGYAVTSLRSNEILEIFKLSAVVEEHAEFPRVGSLAPAAGITLRGLRDCCSIRSRLTSASKST